MRKCRGYAVFFCALILFLSCQTPNSVTPATEKSAPLPKVKSCITYRNGVLDNKETFDQDGKLTGIIRYNPEGTIASTVSVVGNEYIYKYADGTTRKDVYEFDGKGTLVSITAYKTDGGIESKTTFAYDSQNRLFKENTYGSYNTHYWITYTFDAQGKNLTRTLVMDVGGKNISSVGKYKYDGKGRLIEFRMTNSNGKPDGYRKYIYDKSGMLIEEYLMDANEKMEEKLKYEYELFP